MMIGMGKPSCCGGRIDPLPTMLRDVSGRNSVIAVKHDPEAMHRNQNIQGQPAANVRPPPSMGPMLGAIVILVSVSALFRCWKLDLRKRHQSGKGSPFCRRCNI